MSAEFDQEFIADTFGGPTAKQKAEDRRARRKRGRPRIGKGSKTICVTIEKGLLLQADRLAKELHVRRARLIASGLRAVVNREIAVLPQSE
jgi:hypothetical protein